MSGKPTSNPWTVLDQVGERVRRGFGTTTLTASLGDADRDGWHARGTTRRCATRSDRGAKSERRGVHSRARSCRWPSGELDLLERPGVCSSSEIPSGFKHWIALVKANQGQTIKTRVRNGEKVNDMAKGIHDDMLVHARDNGPDVGGDTLIGKVVGIKKRKYIKLCKRDSADGERRYIPLEWVASVTGEVVYLNKDARTVRIEWLDKAAVERQQNTAGVPNGSAGKNQRLSQVAGD
jgi:hypothetical protein